MSRGTAIGLLEKIDGEFSLESTNCKEMCDDRVSAYNKLFVSTLNYKRTNEFGSVYDPFKRTTITKD